MATLVPAEVFPPGDIIREELEARDWTQADLAEIMGRPIQAIGEIVRGKKRVTEETARELELAFGIDAEIWLRNEALYRLHKVSNPSPAIARRARLRQKFPAVREMVRRGWITNSSDPAELENQVLRYFDIPDLEAEPKLYRHAAKRTGYPTTIRGSQLAWLFRVRQIAEAMTVRPYSERLLRDALVTLSALRVSAEEVRQVPKILADCGVRFVIVEPMPGSKIDGVTFWLDDKTPVIGLSLRLDRIDNFWFVLAHEIEHVLNKHGRTEAIIDTKLGDPSETLEQDIAEEERIASDAAAEFCVPRDQMADFIIRHRPLFSDEKIVGFAHAMQVHPGIVVGQLQRALRDYRVFRKHLVSVRLLVAPVAMTDGYGQVLPLSL